MDTQFLARTSHFVVKLLITVTRKAVYALSRGVA
jgi:hypothetical protein